MTAAAPPLSPLTWFDGHLDLTYIADHGRDLTRAQHGVTFPALSEANVQAAISTLFVRRRIPGSIDGPYCFDTPDEAHAAALRQVDMHRMWERHGWLQKISPITSQNRPLPLNSLAPSPPPHSQAPLSFTLALEGAACLRTIDDLQTFHAAGVRIVALAWAEGSHWSGGDQTGGDVTPAGRTLLDQIDKFQCIHDVSHLSEKAFWSVLQTARGKKIASHSNCRDLLPGSRFPERHLSDAQIQALVQAGGIIGINLFARFLLPPDELARRRATSADVVRHLEHITQLAGRRDCVALGSDMDSGFGPDLLPQDIQRPQDLPRLAESLANAGWSDPEIHRFANRWADLLQESAPPR